MKGPQVAALIWLANVVVLAGGALAGYKFWTGIEEDQTVTYAKVSEPKTKEKRIAWADTINSTTTAEHRYYQEVMVSPKVRPPKPTPPDPTPKDPPPPPPEPTDDELKKQLEEWVNQNFDLVRLWYSKDENAKATVLSKEAGGATLIFRAGLKFPEEYHKDRAMDPKVQKLAAYDLTVVSIEYDHVLMKGPSRNAKYKDRYYEVKLNPNKKAFTIPDINKLGKTGKIGESKIKLPDETPPDPNVEVVDTRPRVSVQDENGTWVLGTDDYKNINVDDLAKYAKVVHDREGRPLGIQITEDIPDDNVVVARGGRKGDIIKAINGKPVTSMSDVRRIVREDYNAGVEEFTVTYERDGVPGTKIFKAPKKKDK